MREEDIRNLVVVDASAWLAWMLPDEEVPRTLLSFFDQLKERKLTFLAPTLLKYEFANALRSNFLRKRLSRQKAKKLLNNFLELEIKYIEVDFIEALKIAFTENLTFYDAVYVYLARASGTNLLSLDKKLRKIV